MAEVYDELNWIDLLIQTIKLRQKHGVAGQLDDEILDLVIARLESKLGEKEAPKLKLVRREEE